MIKQDWQKSFKRNFFEKCCKLICEYKPIDKPKYLTDNIYQRDKPENLITRYDYIERIKEVIYKKEISIECGSDQKSGTSYKLVNPDITFSTLDNRLRTFFECKILGYNSKYINKDGIKRFVTEKYGFENMPFYGMLGYVKDGSATDRRKTLQKSIKKKQEDLNLISQSSIKNSEDETIFETKHVTNNSKCNKNIIITHILHSWNKK